MALLDVLLGLSPRARIELGVPPVPAGAMPESFAAPPVPTDRTGPLGEMSASDGSLIRPGSVLDGLLSGGVAMPSLRPVTPGIAGEAAPQEGGPAIRPGSFLDGLFGGESQGDPSALRGPEMGKTDARVPGIPMGLLGAGGLGGMPDGLGGVSALNGPAYDVPPDTNDPTSMQPEVFQDGVPLPRPRPVTGSQVAPPLSLVPDLPIQETSARRATAAAAAAPVMRTGGLFNTEVGSFGDRLSGALARNGATLLALGSGFAGAPSIGTGMRRAFSAAVPASALDRKTAREGETQADVYRSLVARGVPPTEALAATRSPEIMKAVTAKYFETKPAQVVNNRMVRERPDGTVETLADFSEEKSPAGFRRTDAGGLEFIPGGPADPNYKRLVEGGQKEPPKFEWVDPNDHSKGQRAIPGGPGEHLSSEVAGRIALMQEAQSQLPEARRILMEGRGPTGTGISGAAASYSNIGETGRAQRTVRTAIEGALRAMTGAAAPETEVKRYEQMFMPSPLDSPETANQKMDQLEGFINRASELVTRGRRADPNAGRTAPAAAAPAVRRTSSGIQWTLDPGIAGQ